MGFLACLSVSRSYFLRGCSQKCSYKSQWACFKIIDVVFYMFWLKLWYRHCCDIEINWTAKQINNTVSIFQPSVAPYYLFPLLVIFSLKIVSFKNAEDTVVLLKVIGLFSVSFTLCLNDSLNHKLWAEKLQVLVVEERGFKGVINY